MSKPGKSAEIAPRSTNLLSRLQSDIDRMEQMFDSYWPSRLPRLFDWDRTRGGLLEAPALDVYEEGDDIVVKAELPGAEKEDVEVNLADSVLTISGKKERKEEIKEDNYYRCERSYGSFSRSVELPGEVQSGKAQAAFPTGFWKSACRRRTRPSESP